MEYMEEKNKYIKKAIFKTIAFFDIFDYPLTVFEIKKYLNIKISILEILNVINNNKKIKSLNGFYFLDNRKKIVKNRLDRYNYSNQKLKIAKQIVKIYQFLPWIKMIAIGNSIGSNNLKNKSDIDFFIITQKNKIWITRFFCAGIAKFLKIRPIEQNKKDKICLSFYVGENNLDLQQFMIKKSWKIDKYFTYWFANLVPIYDVNNFYKKLIKNNLWIFNCFPNWKPIMSNIKYNNKKIILFYSSIINILFGKLNNISKKIQLKIMPKILNNKNNKNIIINNNTLKLHINDKRLEVIEKHNQYFSKIIS